MKKIPYELRALALEEIYALRDLTTQQERDQLNFWGLRPGDAGRCLLGQMTGRIPNERSNILTGQSLVPLTNYGDLAKRYGIQGGPELAVEIYLRQPWAENYKIVQFLQGIRETLDVDDL